MNNILNFVFEKYEIFLLVLVRTSGIFFVSPFFGSRNVPNIMKIGLTLFLSVILTTTINADVEIGNLDITYTALIVKELMVGLIIGFISYMFFSAFYIVGQIVDMNIGIGMINVIDPQNGIQVPLMGNFYYIIAFLLLLAINGHHVIIRALVDSYNLIPIGGFQFKQDIGFFLVNILSKIFSIGFKLSTPIIAMIFLLDLMLGILVRTMPQMNVFVVGLPLKIMVGLLIVIITISIFSTVVNGVFDDMVNEIYNFLSNVVEG